MAFPRAQAKGSADIKGSFKTTHTHASTTLQMSTTTKILLIAHLNFRIIKYCIHFMMCACCMCTVVILTNKT